MELEVRTVNNLRELYQAYRLVHDQYASTKLIEPRPSHLRFFVRDFLPITTPLVAVIDGKVVGTASMVRYSPIGLPGSSVYPAEIAKLVANSRRIAESTKFACAPVPQLSLRGVGKMSVVSTALLRALFQWCRGHTITDWLLVVHPRVQEFYRDQLGFVELGAEQSCPHVSGRPGVMLGLDVQALIAGEVTPTRLASELFLASKPDAAVLKEYTPYLDQVALLLLSDPAVWADSTEQEKEALVSGHAEVQEFARELERPEVQELPEPAVTLFHPSFEPETAIDSQTGSPARIALRRTLAALLPIFKMQAERRLVGWQFSVDDNVPDDLVTDRRCLLVMVAALSRVAIDVSHTSAVVRARLSGSQSPDGECVLTFGVDVESVASGVLREPIEREMSAVNGIVSWQVHANHISAMISALVLKDALPTGLAAAFQRTGIADLRIQYPRAMGAQLALSILVVEDNQVQQMLLRRVLTEWGHTVVAVMNGEAALRAVLTRHFDLVLLDIQIPILDGFAVCQEVRSFEAMRGGHLPIYAVTAFVLPDDERRCRAVGMDGFIPKPVAVRDLADVVGCIIQARLATMPILGSERVAAGRLVA